eukprot:TRINITY_DN71864_c0_g1_i1.p1 TRINITY_DN71864_c0_g1~~TRINITY_DN71864_c0_g1_i1.p1  ORF type:complete len:954 (+),score=213.58 TRINITY_DN71864_c0_g1_i1:214-2862(+)
MMKGPWRPDAGTGGTSKVVPDGGTSLAAAPATGEQERQLLVRLGVVRALWRLAQARYKDAAATDGTSLDMSVVLTAPGVLLDADAAAEGGGAELERVFPSAGPGACPELARDEVAYRAWLSSAVWSSGESVELQELSDLVTVCLALLPSARPSPADLAGHPALAASADDSKDSSDLRWSVSSSLRCERLVVRPNANIDDIPSEEDASSPSPLESLLSIGVAVEDIFYWWQLAGGDPFVELASRWHWRPAPPIFRVPLFSRDVGDNDRSGPCSGSYGGSSMQAAAGGSGAVAAVAATVPGASESSRGRALLASWGPAAVLRPKAIGVDLSRLRVAFADAERLGADAARSLRLPSPYTRQRHFAYQWLRTRLFERLLLTLPESRQELFREAAIDVPPLLRPRIWAAVLGGVDCESDRGCWAPFYEQLVASPVDLTGEEMRLAMQCPLGHELLSHANGHLRLKRLVQGVLRANPSLTRMDGIGALAAPLAALYPDNEPAAYLALQRILHGFLWHFYSEESPTKRRLCVHLFAALLRFVDPQLELHLQSIGLQPDMYASLWFPTWFVQLFPLNQLVMLWDALMMRPPQFPLFIGVCLMHFFRCPLLSIDEVPHAVSFFASCAGLVDISVLLQASIALFYAVPASVTLPLYPRHSAGEALLGGPSLTTIDPAWGEEANLAVADGDGRESMQAQVRQQIAQRAMEQWRQCEWWRRRAGSVQTPPLITVDDLLSFRKHCFVLDVRPAEEFAEFHFQGSVHVRDPEAVDLRLVLPADVLSTLKTPGPEVGDNIVGRDNVTAGVAAVDPCADGGGGSAWLFAFDADAEAVPELRLRLAVVVGGPEDHGAAFAARMLSVGLRHVVCLLGAAAALKADAASYLTTPAAGGAKH